MKRAWVLIVMGVMAAGCAWSQAPIPTHDDRGRPLPVAGAVPQRIVSLTPTLTEVVCALGGCARLVGVDNHSRWPDSVKALPRLGGLEDAQVERIVALRPDLVLAATSTRVVERLEGLGLRVVALEPRTLAQVRTVMIQVALVLRLSDQGERLWQSVQARIDRAAQRVPEHLRGQSVYFEVASTPYAASESSFIGELLARLGLRNVIPGSLGPFPAVNAEFIIQAQPQWIMGSALEVTQMHRRAGWSRLQALQRARTCGFESPEFDTLMRAGPRLADAADSIVNCLSKAP